MVLPFVRDLFTDVEKLPAFSRVASHLKEGTGRIRVSGLIPTAKALLLVLLQKAAGRPLVVVVADNRAAEELVPVLQAFCELTGGADPDSVLSLPARDVLPFQNLSAASGDSGGARRRAVEDRHRRGVYRGVAHRGDRAAPAFGRVLRRPGAERAPGRNARCRRAAAPPQHRGLHSTDVVEMPGEYALRGGILDVYSPEADRPVRIEFFGDEVESIRKFDPATQRSSNPDG